MQTNTSSQKYDINILKKTIHGFYREEEFIVKPLTYSHLHLHTPKDTTAPLLINKGIYQYIPTPVDKDDIIALLEELDAVADCLVVWVCYTNKGILFNTEYDDYFMYNRETKEVRKASRTGWKYV